MIIESCQTSLNRYFLPTAEIQYQAPSPTPRGVITKSSHRDPLSYVPDTNHLEQFPIRQIRVNIHFLNSADSSQNMTAKEAGKFAWVFLKTANDKLPRKIKPSIPPNNNLPGLPKRYEYVLTPRTNVPGDRGVYCHYDDEEFYYINKGKRRNNASRSVINKYAIQNDSVLNIFLMPHHPDSLLSKTYKPKQAGIALGTSIKISGVFKDGKAKPWSFSGLLNHEIGHVLGLNHAWTHDGCDDTPIHPNCWSKTDESPCDTMASNNVMDYNSVQHAWTPCQIGKIHRNFTNLRSRQRKLLIRNWCTLKPNKTIYISDSTHWKGAKDLESHIIIETGGVLTIDSRVSLPKGAKITVYPKGQLILNPNARLHNDCGDRWAGIEIVSDREEKGTVVFVGKPKVDNMEHSISK